MGKINISRSLPSAVHFLVPISIPVLKIPHIWLVTWLRILIFSFTSQGVKSRSTMYSFEVIKRSYMSILNVIMVRKPRFGFDIIVPLYQPGC